MASFTGVGDNVELAIPGRGELIDIAISGTYNMVIDFQREVAVGGGAWQTIESFSTANATVASTYVSQSFNEKVRLIVITDTSGTAVATLTDNDNRNVQTFTDNGGTERMRVNQLGSEVLGSFNSYGRETVSITAATQVINRKDHAGKIILLDRAGGIDMDLPNATGSGDVYEFIVKTATADAYEISAFDIGDDDVFGVICGADAAAEFTWAAATGNNTVSLGGTAQARGGTVGDRIKFIDFDAGKWHVSGFIHQGGTEATPFSTDS